MMNQEKTPYKGGSGSYNASRSRISSIEGKKPPAAIDLEEAVLGAILSEGQTTYEHVQDVLKGEQCFYAPRHADLWEVMGKVASSGIPVDLLTVANACMGIESASGWSPYDLSQLTTKVASTAGLVSWCRIIQEKYIARQLIETCANITRSAYDQEDVFRILEYAEGAVFDLTIGKTGPDYRKAGAIARESLARIIERRNNPKDLSGIPTGLLSLDRITGGWQDSDLIVLGGKPGLGKTAMALNFAMAAARSGKGVGIFTMEMSESQIMNRLYAIDSLVPLGNIIHANLSNEQTERLGMSMEAIDKLPIWIDDEPALSLFDLRAKARKMKTKEGIGMAIVDYLQLMRGDGQNKGNREAEVASISRGLKALAKSLKVPVLALSQLNQNGEVRESRAIEHDANILMVLDRPDYKKAANEVAPEVQNTAELRVEKNRDGAIDSIPLDTDLSTQRIFEPPEQSQENPYKIFQTRPVDFYEVDKDRPF